MSPLSFLQAGCPSYHSTNSIKTLKVQCIHVIVQIFCVVDDEDKLDAIGGVLCLYKQTALPYFMYVQLKKNERKQGSTDADEVKQYAGFVGGKCARRMLLYRR